MKITASLILASLALSGTAYGQPTLLGPGEISLQLAATGKVESPPDTITVVVPISTSGVTAAAARDANKTKLVRVQAALAARGIAGGKVALLPGQAQFGFIGNAAADEEGGAAAAFSAAMNRKTANAMVQVTVASLTEFAKVTEALDSEDVAMAGIPVGALRDDSSARAAAVASAITQAKRDAESFATPLGLKVVRVSRIANYGDQRMPDWQNSSAWMQQLLTGGGANRQVITTANVWVDFILAPK